MKINHLPAFLGVFALLGASVQAQTILNPLPYKVIGQYATPSSLEDTLSPTQVTPNLVEGREFFRPQSLAVDMSQDPPALWVADTANNRVLGFRDARNMNGAPMADIVLGQRNFNANVPLALSSFPSSVSGPTGVAVDAQGNVFVADAGNNRILRFPRPFAKLAEGVTVHAADLVLGQKTLLTNLPNQSTVSNTLPTEYTIRTSIISGTSRATFNVDMLFDKNGNLWFTDAANNRILRYPAAAVSGPANVGPGAAGTEIAADFCVAQKDFNSYAVNPGRTTNRLDLIDKRLIRFPSGITFDDAGNLYVADDLARVLVYPAEADGQLLPFKTEARRIMGIIIAEQNSGNLPGFVNDTTFGPELSDDGRTFTGGPRGIFSIHSRIYVVDSLFHRILRFAPYNDWPSEAVRYSPSAEAVFGQDDFVTANSNRYQFSEPNAGTFFAPIHGLLADGKVWVTDSQNNRILVLPDLGSVESAAAPTTQAERFIGQNTWEQRSPNLIEGREFSAEAVQFRLGTSLATLTVYPSAVIDSTTAQTRLFIADPGNNRVLAYNDYYRMKAGDRADFVIGQVDLGRALPNSPLMNANGPTREGLNRPSAVALDKAGNLYVADSGNGRVVRYPKPFEKWQNGEPQLPDLVLGAPDFESRRTEFGPGYMFAPTSLTVTEVGKLVVADPILNRILVFQPAEVVGGTPSFASGQDAFIVLGQPDFTSIGGGSGVDQLSLPYHVSTDIDSRVYVADLNNNRVVIYSSLEQLPPGGGANAVFGFGLPNTAVSAIAVSRKTGRIFVGDASAARSASGSWTGQRVMRFPDYFTLVLTGTPAAELQTAAFSPRSIVLDPADNLMVFDTANRATFHYPLHEVRNWASESPRVAPNLVANLRAPFVTFSRETVEDKTTPWKRSLADVEVLVNGIAAPITRSQQDTVRIMVPRDTPSTGRVDFLARRVSTGEILAQNQIQMFGESPAIIPLAVPGGGLVRALNQDGTENSTTNRAAAGQEVTLLMVGYGQIDGAPVEGTAPGSSVPVSGRLVIVMGNQTDMVSSTLDPTEPGVWRLKAKVPTNMVCPNAGATPGQLPVAVAWRDVPSRIGKDGTLSLTTSIYCRN